MADRKLNFIKMHSLGNDFVVFNCYLEENFDISIFSANFVKLISNRKIGVGCDQVIVMLHSKIANCKMIIFNANGNIASACGNATACVAMLLCRNININNAYVTIEICHSLITVFCSVSGEYIVNLGVPFFRYQYLIDDQSFPVNENGYVELIFDKYYFLGSGFVVNVGNPHIVFCVNNFNFDVRGVGHYISNNHIFDEGINVHFIRIKSQDNVDVITYERGVGITNACGTGSASICATLRMIKKIGIMTSMVSIRYELGNINAQIVCDKNNTSQKKVQISLFPEIVFYATL